MRARLAALALVGIAAGCGTRIHVTRPRLEQAVATTFAPLYVEDQALLGHPGLSAGGLAAAASCDRGGRQGPTSGPATTGCAPVVWSGAGGAPLSAVYHVSIHADACYRADGPPAVVGQQQLSLPDGTSAVNPVYAFDGCFRT